VYGKTDQAKVDISNVALGSGGFSIARGVFGDSTVSGAGDVNGDGLADLIIEGSGGAYVVFGKANRTEVNLAEVAAGHGGFAITGSYGGFYAYGGTSNHIISGAGDINGDGLADLIVGYSGYQDPNTGDRGRSYVIFGKADGAEVKLADVAAGGDAAFTIDFNDTTGLNSWIGTTASEVALGRDGNDTLTGNGGADVLYGGLGDDILEVNADNIDHLALGVTNGKLARLDGGGGTDTLKVSGSGVTLDLTLIANQAASNPEGPSRIGSVEIIDLSGSGDNTLNISVNDVLDMSGMNLFNNGVAGWSGALGASVAKHQVVVDGNGGDAINLKGGWLDTGTTAVYGGNTYEIYNASNSAAQLLVDTDITRNVVI
jgi:hypothetical protein